MDRRMGFVTVGLTGGIASGKSTVARFFAELGVPIVDADQVAREVVKKGTEGLAEVVAEFGEGILDEDGSLDRKALGDRVFADQTARKRLEAILHPRIAARSAEKMAELGDGASYVVYEAPLIVENGLHRAMAALVVVSLDEEIQLARLMARDGIDEEAARARVAAQLPLRDKVAVADYVIDNGGDVEATRARVREVHEALIARFRKGKN
jgi:dephospho-CoA kinase